MLSAKVLPPNFVPVLWESKCGARLMFSIPPATTISASPKAMACAPIITAFIPEEHTLLMVVQGTVSGIPA